MKDWTGSSLSIYKTLGSSQHAIGEREVNDYYATDPKAAEILLQLETFAHNIWEPACGAGHLSNVFIEDCYNVRSTDLIDRGFGQSGVDFLSNEIIEWNGDIITNPPYKFALAFIKKSLQIIPVGHKVAMFLKIQFLEGKERKDFFTNNPPKVIYVSSSRLSCAQNADFDALRTSGGSAVAYAWYIWVKGFKGDTIVKWFN